MIRGIFTGRRLSGAAARTGELKKKGKRNTIKK